VVREFDVNEERWLDEGVEGVGGWSFFCQGTPVRSLGQARHMVVDGQSRA